MKTTKTQREACEKLIRMVRFETAQFGVPMGLEPRPEDGYLPTSEHEVTEFIQHRTRLYVESWIVPVLEALRDGDTKRLQDHVK